MSVCVCGTGYLRQLLNTIDECRRVPQTYVSDGMHRPSNAQVGYYAGNIQWLAFSFQSVSINDIAYIACLLAYYDGNQINKTIKAENIVEIL